MVKRGSPTTGRMNSSPKTPRAPDQTPLQRKALPLKEGYRPVINLVTSESTPANPKKNLELHECLSPPPPSMSLKSSRQKEIVKKKVLDLILIVMLMVMRLIHHHQQRKRRRITIMKKLIRQCHPPVVMLWRIQLSKVHQKME